MNVTTTDALRALYPAPTERAVRKQISALDEHCRRFIERSPFLILSTGDRAHNLDASPRGGAPGFVKVAADGALLAFMRSRLWQADAKVERGALPTAGKMISDQTGLHVAPETPEQMARRYAPDL